LRSPKGEALLCAPNRGFWPYDFSVALKTIAWKPKIQLQPILGTGYCNHEYTFRTDWGGSGVAVINKQTNKVGVLRQTAHMMLARHSGDATRPFFEEQLQLTKCQATSL